MKTDTSSSDTFGTTNELSAGAIFDLLTARHRRYALYYLSQKVGTVTLSDLAEQITLWEDDPSRERFERVSTGLHHGHLPKLVDANVVRYDPAAETVTRLSAGDALDRYLDLSIVDDLGA